ncbi:MAG TPA: hypothetical protein DCZ20_00790 [Lachnospiraceae bacterium]|nr:hypothetical protein [Lachnospiraceae bacterium]
MIQRICISTAVFLLALYCFFLYDDAIVACFLIVEPAYILSTFFILKMMKKHLCITMEQVIPIAEKDQDIPVRVTVKNTSRLPLIHFRIWLQMENSFTGEKESYQMEGRTGYRDQQTLLLMLRARHCGNLKITLKRCWIYDYLFVCKEAVRLGTSQRIGVLPQCHLLMVDVTRRTREFLADADEYSDRESGNDPSDIYQIREYREQDSIHDIHWKLSAKADELLVKERGKPLGCAVLIWLNLDQSGYHANDRNGNRRRTTGDESFTNLLEVASSLAFSLLEERCVHMVAWYEPKNRMIQKKRISKEEHIYELMNRMLFVEPYQDGKTAGNQYEEAFRGVTFSTVVEFRLDGSVWINGEKQMKIPVQSQSIKWNEMYFTV